MLGCCTQSTCHSINPVAPAQFSVHKLSTYSPVKMCLQPAILPPSVHFLPLTLQWKARGPGVCCLLLLLCCLLLQNILTGLSVPTCSLYNAVCTNLAVDLLVPSLKSFYTSTYHVLNTLDIFLVATVTKTNKTFTPATYYNN